MNKPIIYKTATVISAAVFLIALTQKCYCTTASCGDSWAALLMGTIGFLFGGAALAWLANPLLLVSWATVKAKPKVSLICSLLAVSCAFSFLFFKKIIADEAGNYAAITGYKVGYLALVVQLLSNAFSQYCASLFSA